MNFHLIATFMPPKLLNFFLSEGHTAPQLRVSTFLFLTPQFINSLAVT